MMTFPSESCQDMEADMEARRRSLLNPGTTDCFPWKNVPLENVSTT